jgi:WD40 repeat protein
MFRRLVFVCLVSLVGSAPVVASDDTPPAPISFSKQIRPILQASCQGCHQPARQGGGYDVTTREGLLKGGSSEEAAVVPGKPDESGLIDQITPDSDGKALMPKDHPPLPEPERKRIADWIAQGAVDDTPSNAAAVRYDAANPPVYSRPPVIGAIDVSPDGSLLAVGGFHEVLLWKADGTELLARLIGLSERIESLAFSPDGKRIAVAGGLPARMGELQIWDVDSRSLRLSLPVTADSLRAVSWSPDGSLVAFGCADNTVRAVDSTTGEQRLFMGSHSDWPLDTVFSLDGSHLVSVGRDMSVKLTEVATQRFVDNVTSITPGALKGGVQSVARHPSRDEIVIGGSDGQPRVYRLFRLVQRVIGDDSNIIRQFPAMPGRINAVAVSPNGALLAAASSNDGAGQLDVYAYDFDSSLPDPIKVIMAKVSTSRSAEENAALDAYTKQGVRRVATLALPSTALYTIDFAPNGSLFAAGSDGLIRIVNTTTGSVDHEFAPAPVGGSPREVPPTPAAVAATAEAGTSEPETVPDPASIAAIDVLPDRVDLAARYDSAQLVVTARLNNGDTLDLTRTARYELSSPVADIAPSGLITPRSDGTATIRIAVGDRTVERELAVSGVTADRLVDFIHDVGPALSRMGCNTGTCHGAAAGKAGFKLSLRGYDPLFDVRALTDDHASRRVNVASPDDSLMLLKLSGAVPHVGGQLSRPGEPYYEVVRNWIAGGASLDTSTPRVTSLRLEPVDPIIQKIGDRQQLRVVATYADGSSRDVTREAFLESSNIEVGKVEGRALVTTLRRGEVPLLARFEGAYASTTLTVMGDRTGFAWTDPPAYNHLDELAAAKWKRLKIRPSEVCTDAEFLRRATIDLTGLPPTVEEVRAFLADPAESRAKREALVDRLIGSDAFIDHWTNKWADLLQVNRKFLAPEGAIAFRAWIRQNVAANTPYDQFVRQIVTATGSNRENPAASYFKILREPTATMENTTQLFLAVRFNCNKCHDHPFERWTQDQYYQTAAYFARVGLEADPESKGRNIGGTDVEGAKPLYEKVSDVATGEVIHDRTKAVTEPAFPYPAAHETKDGESRREEFAAWLTSAENPYFARSYVNRLWGYMTGVGLIEPLDDARAGNPPSNPQLLDELTREFVASGFDTRHILRLIARSRTYQLSVATNEWNADDRSNASHGVARRLPAEVLLDAVYRVTGSTSKIPGVPPGTRAAALPDVGVELPSGFLNTFGRPVRESACECERSTGLQLGPVMALVSGPTLADAIADPDSDLTRLAGQTTDDTTLVRELFLRILNRPATDAELASCLESFGQIEADHRALAELLAKRELEVALARPRQERERLAAVAQAEAALARYRTESEPARAEAEAARVAKLAAAEADLAAYQRDALPKSLADWVAKQSPVNRWTLLDADRISGGGGKSTFEKQPDRSIVASGDLARGEVQVTTTTDLTGLTAFRLEVLPFEGLPQNGPGRASDGNFVLTQFEVFAAPKDRPTEMKPIKLVNPLADFSQEGFPVANTINGDRTNQGTGWAVYPRAGTTHWATFEAAEPIGFPAGTVLTFKFLHYFNDGAFQLGRFRLSATRVPSPGLDLPEDFRAYVATTPELRTEAQTASLLAYLRLMDDTFRARQAAVEAARTPLPPDARLVQLESELAALKQPLPPDAELERLRADVEQSVRQSATARLTVAQDVAWALINSPAFLFNH